MDERIEIYRQIQKIYKDSRDKKILKCITKNKNLDRHFNVSNRIGTDSISGEIFNARVKKMNYQIAVKKTPIKSSKLKYFITPNRLKSLNNSFVLSELFFLKLCSLLSINKVSPNLPVIYGYYVCINKCLYENKSIDIPYKNCLITLMEKEDGDFKDYVLSKKASRFEILCSYFQIFTGLYTLKKYFNMVHNDLHWGNILLRRKQRGYIEYIEGKKNYIVPDFGYYFIIADFGQTNIRNFINPVEYSNVFKKNNKKLVDYDRISTMLLLDKEQTCKEYDEISKYLLSVILNAKKEDKSEIELMSKILDFLYFFEVIEGLKNIKDYEGYKLEKTLERKETFNLDTEIKTKNKLINKILRKN